LPPSADAMSPNRPNLILDEQSFEGLLSAAFTIKEHNDHIKQSRQTKASGESRHLPTNIVCRHCGAVKASAGSHCESCGLEDFRPGERLQRNWASMWLRSQYQQEHPPDADDPMLPEGTLNAPADNASNNAPDNGSNDGSNNGPEESHLAHQTFPQFASGDSNSSMATTNTNLTKAIPGDGSGHADFESNFDLNLSLLSDANDTHTKALARRLSDWRVKLRFQRADLYLGLAIFVAATALLWPSAVPRRSTSLDPWERALVTLGIAEEPAPLIHSPGDPKAQVWIDPHTALYYCLGEEQYGKTEDGRFSSQREAQMDRFEPAGRSACE
jgi:ribosomal protein L40E